MDKLFNILTYVIGFLFLLMGLQWLVDPTSAAAGLGMSLLSGHGLSTQIGDLASFFLVVGVFTLCAPVFIADRRMVFGGSLCTVSGAGALVADPRCVALSFEPLAGRAFAFERG